MKILYRREEFMYSLVPLYKTFTFLLHGNYKHDERAKI